MAKELLNLYWVEELLPKGYIRKPMFGGFAFYFESRLVLVLFESTGERSYNNKKYNFELWNGCLFPAEREHHPEILKKFTFLINHPVLPKWLYLPLDTEDFEAHALALLKEIRKLNLKFGVIPKQKKSKFKKIKHLKTKRVKTHLPQMFSDEPKKERFNSAQKITDLKNLGPATEIEFTKAGIKTVQQFLKLGWKKTMIKISRSNPKNIHSIFAYAVIGALKNQDWHKISHIDKLAAREFMKNLREKKSKKNN